MDGESRYERSPVNVALIALIGLSVEFWIVVTALLVPAISNHMP